MTLAQIFIGLGERTAFMLSRIGDVEEERSVESDLGFVFVGVFGMSTCTPSDDEAAPVPALMLPSMTLIVIIFFSRTSTIYTA